MKYEVTIREIAEHWNFFDYVQADSRDEAYALAAALVKSYGRGFRLVAVR